MKPVVIKWRDSQLYITQQSKTDDFDICVITSVGYIIEQDSEKIVLAGDLIGEDIRRVLVIPRENIIK